MDRGPQLLVLGGANGSGKTTVARKYAETAGFAYLGADDIAQALSRDDPASQRVAAGREFVRLLQDKLQARESVIVETTLSGLTFRRHVCTARRQGYEITIAQMHLGSDDLCVARVAQRVRQGGHHVPEADIRRRFQRTAVNFWQTYRQLADHWILLSNATTELVDFAIGSGEQTTIRDPVLFSNYLEVVGAGTVPSGGSPLSIESYARLDELLRIAAVAVAEAQATGRRNGVPNVYRICERIYFETPSGGLSTTDPLN